MAGNDSNTKLLVHFNKWGKYRDEAIGTGGSLQSGRNIHCGGTIDETTKKFGSASYNFNGTDEDAHWNYSGASEFHLGTDDYTIDFWANLDSTGVEYSFLGAYYNSDNYFRVYVDSSGAFHIKCVSLGSLTYHIYTATGKATAGSWVHLAFVRSSGSSEIYINGVASATSKTEGTASPDHKSTYIYLCQDGNDATYFKGNIDEFRWSNVARWTSGFTPPTSAYIEPAEKNGLDSYVKLLLQMEGADESTTFLDSSDSAHTVTAQGNAKIDTARYKYGSSAGYFDGNDDYLSIADSNDWYIGSNDFTVDAWIMWHTAVNRFSIFEQYVDSDNYITCHVNGNDMGQKSVYLKFSSYADGDVELSCSTYTVYNVSTYTWYHVMFVIKDSNIYFFWNGELLQVLSQTQNTTTLSNFAAPLHISKGYNTASYCMNGWIDQVRVSNGIARQWRSFELMTEAYSKVIPIMPFIRNRRVSPINKIPNDVLVW